MGLVNLTDEHCTAVRNLKTEDAVELIDRLGISYFLIMIFQMVGIAPIRLDKSGWLWDPDPDGDRLAYITPIRLDRLDTPISVEPWADVRCGEIVDLIAWDPRSPRRWALRTAASLWLGSIPYEPFPALIRATPLSWLQADCDGICVLTRKPVEARNILADFKHGIHAENDQLTARLNALVRQPTANPPLIMTRPPPP